MKYQEVEAKCTIRQNYINEIDTAVTSIVHLSYFLSFFCFQVGVLQNSTTRTYLQKPLVYKTVVPLFSLLGSPRLESEDM